MKHNGMATFKPPCAANRFSASQVIPRNLCNPNVHYLSHTVPATYLYPDSARSSPHPHIPHPEDPS